jgi:hypothetical protein
VVSRLDREAVLPVYPVLREYVASVANVSDLSTAAPCPLLYPGEEQKATLDYLPVCRSLGICESSLLLGLSTKLDIKDMTNALVIELFQYAGKYCSDIKNELHSVLFSLFAVSACSPLSLWRKTDQLHQTYRQKYRRVPPSAAAQAFLARAFTWPGRSKSAGPTVRSRVGDSGKSSSSVDAVLQKAKVALQSETITHLTGQRRDLQREAQQLRRTVSESLLNAETLESTLEDTQRQMVNAARREDYHRTHRQQQKVELETSLGKAMDTLYAMYKNTI